MLARVLHVLWEAHASRTRTKPVRQVKVHAPLAHPGSAFGGATHVSSVDG
jgi:hypothetical protein